MPTDDTKDINTRSTTSVPSDITPSLGNERRSKEIKNEVHTPTSKPPLKMEELEAFRVKNLIAKENFAFYEGLHEKELCKSENEKLSERKRLIAKRKAEKWEKEMEKELKVLKRSRKLL